jgi:outer membrane protein TolC
MSPARMDRRATVRAFGIGLCLVLAAGSLARADDAKPDAKDGDKLLKLLQARVDAAQKLCDLRMEQYKAGRIGIEQVAAAGKRLCTAQLALTEKKESRVSICEKNLELCTTIKQLADQRHNAGVGSAADVEQAEYERLEAEILLEREKAN